MQQNYGYQQGMGNQKPPGSRRKLNHASTLRRIGAYIIDSLLLGLLIGLIIMAVFLTGYMTLPRATDPSAGMTDIYFSTFYLFAILLSAFLTLGYFTYFESKSGGGATLAKRLLSIQVVDQRGRNVSIGKSFIRNIARLLWNIPCIGTLIMIVDVILIATKDQRIGDKLAKTYVVKEKNGSIYKKTWYPPSQGQQGYQQPQKPQQQQPQQRQPPRQRPKQQQPSQPSPSPSIQQGEERACPDCGKSMKYIEASQQWYCYSCGEYK
ncbi:MAG: RDD family protein [Candidatus Thermoplasmatota archaeon]